MDIDALTDEVIRRLMEKIRQEQDAGTTAKPTQDILVASPCSGASKTTKQVITQEQAANTAPGSTVVFAKGSIITPLARDTFKERGICVKLE